MGLLQLRPKLALKSLFWHTIEQKQCGGEGGVRSLHRATTSIYLQHRGDKNEEKRINRHISEPSNTFGLKSDAKRGKRARAVYRTQIAALFSP